MSGSQAIRLLVSLAAAYFFYDAGQDMSGIRSVSGDSINEAFYQAFGTLSYGLAVLSVVIGLPANPPAGLRDPGKAKADPPANPVQPLDGPGTNSEGSEKSLGR